MDTPEKTLPKLSERHLKLLRVKYFLQILPKLRGQLREKSLISCPPEPPQRETPGKETSMVKRAAPIFLIIGLFLITVNDEAKGENWKHFFKDKGGTWYYDKDSIHYPNTTKGFLGSTKTDKNIVRVWTKFEDRSIFLEELRCSQRESQTVKFQDLQLDSSRYIDETFLSEDQIKELDKVLKKQERTPIIPESREERLYREVCK